MENIEIWKDVLGYEGLYQVSNLGNVKSLNYNKTGIEKNLKIFKNRVDYFSISLSKNNIIKTRRIHQLVAEAFLNHVPCGRKLVVNHIDFNKQNNNVNNLEIITMRENSNLKHLPSSSKYVGVSWREKTKKWVSEIWINKKNILLGHFDDELEASEYYENALKAHLNNEEIVVNKRINSSKYKGISWHKNRSKWRATIKKDKKVKHLGYFDTELEAYNSIISLNL